jgi:hypothetical protein
MTSPLYHHVLVDPDDQNGAQETEEAFHDSVDEDLQHERPLQSSGERRWAVALFSAVPQQHERPLQSSGERRWAVALFSACTILLFADQNLMSPNLTAIAADFGFSDEDRDKKLGGQIALAFFVLGAPVSFFIGCLADSYNRSRLFAWTVGIGEGACFLTYWTTTYRQLYICRAITGLSLGGALPLGSLFCV